MTGLRLARPEPATAPLDGRIGAVVIGRDEGERLVRCLESLPPGIPLVYVDSGSSDGSAERARRRGAAVVELDAGRRFTAARARDAGFERLIAAHPGVELVQFVDGDTELLPGWIAAARAALEDPGVAVACGRLRERFREASVYNRLCDLEWDGPVGEIDACGGTALIRARAYRDAGGFDARLAAGEEPELCLRVRRKGHRVVRIAADMALHDAGMTRFGQWARRAFRSGRGFASLGALHPGEWSRPRRAVLLWGGALPAAAIAAAAAWGAAGLLLLAAYPLQWLRIARAGRAAGRDAGDAALYATFCLLGRFPECAGYLAERAARRGDGR